MCLSVNVESPEDKEWLEQDTMAGVYIEAIRGSAEEENRGVGSGIRTAAAASRDSLHDRLVDVLDNATAIRGEEWALEASAQGPDEETTSVSVLLGIDELLYFLVHCYSACCPVRQTSTEP